MKNVDGQTLSKKIFFMCIVTGPHGADLPNLKYYEKMIPFHNLEGLGNLETSKSKSEIGGLGPQKPKLAQKISKHSLVQNFEIFINQIF